LQAELELGDEQDWAERLKMEEQVMLKSSQQ
jgi:hypothetical protein